MGRYDNRPCPCGSGKESWWEDDARGIPLARVCDDCRERKLKGYRREVLANPRYEADEPIDPDTDEAPGERCNNPQGHEFVCTGTAYGGEDESYHGEGRSYCIHCGADGDA